MAANPFLTFTAVATRSGKLVFSWEGDNGFSQTETMDLTVEA
jgi:sulfur-oxidizing protein SoxZ